MEITKTKADFLNGSDITSHFIGQMIYAVLALDPIKCLIDNLWERSFACQIALSWLRGRAYRLKVGYDYSLQSETCKMKA